MRYEFYLYIYYTISRFKKNTNMYSISKKEKKNLTPKKISEISLKKKEKKRKGVLR